MRDSEKAEGRYGRSILKIRPICVKACVENINAEMAATLSPLETRRKF